MITNASQTKWRLEADEKFRKKIQKHLDSFVVVNQSKYKTIAKGIVDDYNEFCLGHFRSKYTILYYHNTVPNPYDGVCWVSKTKVLAHIIGTKTSRNTFDEWVEKFPCLQIVEFDSRKMEQPILQLNT